MLTVLLNLFYIRKVFLEGTSKSSTAFFTVQRSYPFMNSASVGVHSRKINEGNRLAGSLNFETSSESDHISGCSSFHLHIIYILELVLYN